MSVVPAEREAVVDFNQDEPPRYSDFSYVSFTLGMTFRVSDTEPQNNDFRRIGAAPGLRSYLFGAGINPPSAHDVSGSEK